MVAAHAVLRRDGYLGLMLINKDPKNAATAQVSLRGRSFGVEGRRIDYGSRQAAASAAPAVSNFSAPGSDFTVTIPPYTITDILLQTHK